MKPTKYIYLAAMLVAAFAATACSSDDIIADEPANDVDELKMYTMTVEARKGEEFAKRANELKINRLNATWKTGEEVKVYNETKSQKLGGSLVAQRDGASTTMEGTLTGDIDPGDELTLNFLSPDYDGQDGTLEYIAAHCDYAKASVIVAGIESGEVKTTGKATFENQQAIVKFTLKDNEDKYKINTKELMIYDGSKMYNVKPSSLKNEIYVALPNISNKGITLYANKGLNNYGYHKSGVTFANGQYYEMTVKMNNEVDIKKWDSANTVKSGDVLRYNNTAVDKIPIEDGAVVIINGIEVESDAKDGGCLHCLGDATIILKENNKIKGNGNYPAIFVPEGKTLTIMGDGTLEAIGKLNGAGIGGGKDINCGNIIIKSGTITANGNGYSAGIGSGKGGSCGNISIEGDSVTATGGIGAAGIGCGYGGSCGDIIITKNVTSVTAIKGDKAINSIGSAYKEDCGSVNIGGGAIIGSVPQSPFIYDAMVQKGTNVEWTGEKVRNIKACKYDSDVRKVISGNKDGIHFIWFGDGKKGDGWDGNMIRLTKADSKLAIEYENRDKKIWMIDIDAENVDDGAKLSPGWTVNSRKLFWMGGPSKRVELYLMESKYFEVIKISRVNIILIENEEDYHARAKVSNFGTEII